MGIRHIVFALIVAAWPSMAAADSDGNFCSMPGVLAFDSIASAGGRTFSIVRFDPLGGIQPAERVDITDDIQTHAMFCKPKVIEVYSWDHVYLIDISVPGAPRVAGKRRSQIGRNTRELPNLGHWAQRPSVVVLQTIGDDEQFELVIAKVSVIKKGLGVDTYTSTDLVHRVGREIRAQQRLFFGVFRETVD